MSELGGMAVADAVADNADLPISDSAEAENAGGGGSPFDFFGGLFGGGSASSDSEPSGSGRGRGGSKGATAKVRAARDKVDMLLTTVDLFVQQVVDNAAAMTDQERELIAGPLAGMVAESKELARVAGIGAPLSLILGVTVYTVRVGGIWSRKHPGFQEARRAAKAKQEAAKQEREHAQAQPPDQDNSIFGKSSMYSRPDPEPTFIPVAPEMLPTAPFSINNNINGR